MVVNNISAASLSITKVIQDTGKNKKNKILY